MKKAFTLIELLVVMVIAAVIMAVGIPSFMNIGKGKAMRTATSNIRSVVSLSRQWAITHRENVTIRYGEFFNGLHTEAAGETLVDRGGSFPIDGSLKNHVLFKITGGGNAKIITNTANTITAPGLNWAPYDRYRIDDPPITLSSYCVNNGDGDYIQKSEPLPADVVFNNDSGVSAFSGSMEFTSTGGLSTETNKIVIIADRHTNGVATTILIQWLTGGITVQ